MQPIWKDYFVNLGEADSYQYRILLADTEEVIYSGKAYKRPGEESVSIRINDVCADYFQNVLPALSQAGFSEMALTLGVKIQMYDEDAWSDVESVAFLNDWSYDYDYDAATMGISFPITHKLDARQYMFISVLDSPGLTAVLHKKDGTSQIIPFSFGEPGDFANTFSNGFRTYRSVEKTGVAVINLADYSDIDHITIGNETWKVVTECAKYALYYVNAYGGWDTFLIEGNDLASDSLNRYNREMEYDNRNIQNRGKDNFVNEITKRITLHTGWLSDLESSRMHHLINSTDVYLYDLASGQMIPVLITDNSVDYKTYHNQGNQMVNYTIQVEVAQNRIRR